MKSIINRLFALALTTAILFALCNCVFAAKSTFSDTDGHWAEGVINDLTDAGIINGCDNGRCCPDEIITRAQFAALVARAQHRSGRTATQSPFTDISGHWAERNILALVNARIIIPSEFGNMFQPDTPITKIEMVRMVVRAISSDVHAASRRGTTGYSDDKDISPADSGFINSAKEYSIISAHSGEAFGPNNTATRADGFVMIKNMLNAITVASEEDAEYAFCEAEVVVPAPEIELAASSAFYVGDSATITATAKNTASINWLLTNDNGDDFNIDSLTDNGGDIAFNEAGDYCLTATAIGENGETANASLTFSIEPIPTIQFHMPDHAYAGEAFDVAVEGTNLDGLEVTWLFKEGDNTLNKADYIGGDLGNDGGSISFEAEGDFTVSASITDKNGQIHEHTQDIKVRYHTWINIQTIETTFTDSPVLVAIFGAEADEVSVTWSAQKDGEDYPIEDLAYSSLGKADGTLSFPTEGNYTITVTVTDALGEDTDFDVTITVFEQVKPIEFEIWCASRTRSSLRNFVFNNKTATSGTMTMDYVPPLIACELDGATTTWSTANPSIISIREENMDGKTAPI